ncbi:hypothetical protein ACH4UT_04675 [Streptomyces sp. NPDC020799]|uniref:hypothetical protein n=1 Tax=Streptomyces sp. NPDC020799 TaxID=3365091 RepID=UPI0037BBB4B0
MSEPVGTQGAPEPTSDPSIDTVAGNGNADYTGDGHAAGTASLCRPNTVATDAFGNVYLADTDNHRVRKVDAKTQTITTFAGDGSADYGGDGGPAAKASLNGPCGVAVGSDGSLYISDTQNHRVRKVSGLPVPAQIAVWSGGMTTLDRSGGAGWPGVYVKALGDGWIPPQTVSVQLPKGKNLRFSGSGTLLVYLADGSPYYYGGTVSADKQTFTTNSPVDLHLSGAGATNSLLVAVEAPDGAELGEAQLTFTVGDLPPTAAPVDVVVGFSVTPGGPTTVRRGQDLAMPGMFVNQLGVGKVPPQTVSVRLPEGKNLQFHGGGNLLVWGDGRQLASYGGTLSEDKQTFTTNGPVDLRLSGPGASNSLLILVHTPEDAVLGDTNLTFTVGGKQTVAPVTVIDK